MAGTRWRFVAALLGLLLGGCVTTREAGSLLGAATAGAAVGALSGAALGPKGEGRRSDAAVRGAMGGAALGSVYGYDRLLAERERQRIAAAEAAALAARRGGTTRCRSTKSVAADGRVSLTEECSSQVERPGYRNF